jgi:L-alanine-DL-glutamate epimerase-like enolase superfamily enzyme
LTQPGSRAVGQTGNREWPGSRAVGQSGNGANGARVCRLNVAAYRIPTRTHESDGTLEWTATTLVVVHVQADGQEGIGYTYADTATAHFVSEHLSNLVVHSDALDVPAVWQRMRAAVRNVGGTGVAAMAIAAVDTALWDLKAKLLGVPLVTLLGAVREEVDVYGSGGFTSYTTEQLCTQLTDWVGQGICRVKMKVGRDPLSDPERVRAARRAIGPQASLFVDANGAYTRKQALLLAERFAESLVSWFEEPVATADLEGFRLLRDRAPAGMNIAGGEYGYETTYFHSLLQNGAVDVLQADATRCCGISGLQQVNALCEAYNLPLSTHTAPALHLHVACALPRIVHVEYFFDHVRIEQMLLDGAVLPTAGALRPDLTRPGMGLELKDADAQRYQTFHAG